MSAEQWLSLTDFASKYRISVSTLRRRIKGHQIAFRFDDGKYLILDAPPEEQESRPVESHFPMTSFNNSSGEASQGTGATLAGRILPIESLPLYADAEKIRADLDQLGSREEPILSSASKLLNELKRAYMSILHEKEEQMIQLKEEVSDLKTLVRVLEDDNDRLRRAVGERVLQNM